MTDFLTARWENLIMANYEVDPAILQAYLPVGTELDFYDGKAYVSLVGFMFIKSKIFGIPIPMLGTFEEVNLRFYVKRKVQGVYKRGVVFINETVPNKSVAWLANKLYKEHYIAIPTKHKWEINLVSKKIEYFWKLNNHWNHLKVDAQSKTSPMVASGFEAFIFEHYYGYTRISDTESLEYKIDHPSWLTNKVNAFEIQCDFRNMYGEAFAYLKDENPDAVFLAEGSAISVKWKRHKI
jgi:uncharacterized protein